MKAIRLSAQPEKRTRSNRASATWKHPLVSLEQLAKPEPGPRDLLLKTAYCGICGSDFHLSEPGPDSAILYPGLLELPVTLGHEFSALVAGYGSAITDEEKKLFPLNSPLTAEEMLWCGECATCRTGNVNHCENLEELGFTRDGAQAEFLSVGIQYCWSLGTIEKSLGRDNALRAGALVEPYAVAYRALFQGAQRAEWNPEKTLLIYGAGPIGLACLDTAIAAGVGKAVIVEPVAERRTLAKKMGAHACFSGQENNLGEKILSATQKSIDWIIDAAGTTNEVISIAEKVLAVGGSICLLARAEGRGSLDAEFLITKNARIFGSQGHSGEATFGQVIKLMAENKIHPLSLLDKVVDFQEATQRLNQHARSPGKLLLKPHGDAL